MKPTNAQHTPGLSVIDAPNVFTQPHECEAANTISASLTIHGLDVTICAFDRSPESAEKVVRLARALSALFKVMEDSIP